MIHTRIALLVVLSIAVASLTAVPAAAAQEDAPQTVTYRGIRPNDPLGKAGLRNPERGWRIETLIAEPPDADIWGPAAHLKPTLPPAYSELWWILDAERYEPFGLTLAQTYCYLDRFMDRPISDEKLDLLRENLDAARRRGLKTLLRFAYEKTMDQAEGPAKETILGHLDQLAPVIQENADVIYVLQAGFVGAWGEWHSSAKGLEKNHNTLSEITLKLLEVLPKDRMTQVRVPKYKRWVLGDVSLEQYTFLDADTAYSGTPLARIGFHNDGFLAYNNCGGTWTEPPHYSNPGNPEFDFMTAESPFVPVDGELFWSDIGNPVDGLRAAIRMRLHHYSSFSLAHSYSEREGKPFSIDAWMRTPLTLEQVTEAKLPVSDGYFEGTDGQSVPRTVFEYIQDHLGYRIELQSATFPRTAAPGDVFDVEIQLINRGFSTLHNPRPVFLALIKDEVCVATVPVDADPRAWQPYAPGDETYAPLTHILRTPLALRQDLEPGWYVLGLWLPDQYDSLRMDPRYAVRAANGDVPWWTDSNGRFGINILGAIEVRR